MSPQRSPHLWASFGYAGAGLLEAYRTQRNVRIHLAVSVLVVIVGLWVDLQLYEWAIIALTISAVLTAEIVNTAAETLVDLASPDYHPLARRVKDLAAAGVLVRAIGAAIVGLLILGPPLLRKLGVG